MIFHAMNPYHMQAIMAAYSVIIMLILIKFYNPYKDMHQLALGWSYEQSMADWGPVGSSFFYNMDIFYEMKINAVEKHTAWL